MKPILTDELRQALLDSGGRPLEIIDDSTHRVFYLISAEQYQQARRFWERIEEIDPSLYEVEDVHLTQPQ